MVSANWWPDTGASAVFLAPAAIYSGRGSSRDVVSILREHLRIAVGTKVLVAADDAVVKAGLLEGMLQELRNGGYEITLAGGFGTEPSDVTIDAAAVVGRATGAQVVIGVGGGSVLDSSKVLSLLLRNDGVTVDWLGMVDPPEGVTPLVLIPTTCGTGSEATPYAVVTVDGIKRVSACNRYIAPVTVLDPDLLVSLPGGVVASTGMDALAHSVESIMSTRSSPMSVHHATEAIRLLIGNLERAVDGDAESRARCLWAAHLAGQALNAAVVVGHSLAYAFAHEVPMPHGTSCALALPYCIAYNQNIGPGRSRALALALTDNTSEDLTVAARHVKDLATRVGQPVTLNDARIPDHREAAIAKFCIEEYPRPNNPEPLDEQKLVGLLRAMRNGDLDAAFAVTAAENTDD